MAAGLTELTLCIHGSPPYGFRIAGGDGEAVIVARVRNGSKAEQTGLKEGDVVMGVNGVLCKNLSYDSIFGLTEYDEDQLSLVVLRGGGNVHKWREASERLVGEMRLLNEEQVKDMLKFRTAKLDKPGEKQIFQPQMPNKRSIVSSSPISVMIDGNEIKIERGSSEVVHVPLKMEGGQRVFVREFNQPEVVRKEESYSFSSHSTKDLPSNKEDFYAANTIPKITHTFVSQNNFRLGNSLSEKMDSALNSSIFFDSPPQPKHNHADFQADFHATQNHVSTDSTKPVLHNNLEKKALEKGEYIIPVTQEPPNKFQSVAKFDMKQNKPAEEKINVPQKPAENKTPIPPKPLEHKTPIPPKPLEGFLFKQNSVPVKKTHEDTVEFTSTKMFSDYLPKSSFSYQPMFKPDWQQTSKQPQSATDYPFMNFSSDFQDKKEIEEHTKSDFVSPSYAAPTMKHDLSQNGYQQFPYQPLNPSDTVLPKSTIPIAPPSPQIDSFNSGESKVPKTEKESMNNKVALAKNVALSVLSEANQNSKGQKMFLAKRQKSEKWTIQGPDPPKPPPSAFPSQQPDLSKATFNSNDHNPNVTSNNHTNEGLPQENNHSTDPSTFEKQSVPQPFPYQPSYPTLPQLHQFPSSTFPQQPSIDSQYHAYNPHQPWSHPQYPYPPSYPQHNSHAPPNAFPYQPNQPHQFYQPYQQTQQPYYSPHPHMPYYAAFPQTQPQVHPYQPTPPHHQPTPPHHQPTPPHHQPAPPHHQPTPPHHQPAPPHHQPAPPHHQPAQPHHQPAPPHHQPAPPHHQPAPPNHQPTPPHHQPAPPHHQPTPPHHQPTHPHQYPNNPHYQPTHPYFTQTPSHPPHPPSHLTQPHSQPTTHPANSQEIVDYCDL